MLFINMSTCEEQLAELKIYYVELLDRTTKQLVDQQNEIEYLHQMLNEKSPSQIGNEPTHFE